MFFGTARAVGDVSLALEPGETLAVVGPSGSGKTTLLRMVAGFEAPNRGEIALDGRTVAGLGAWVPPEARRLGMVFQDYALFPHMNVLENVAFGLKKWSRRSRDQRARNMLDMVRLPHPGGALPPPAFGRRAAEGSPGPFPWPASTGPPVGRAFQQPGPAAAVSSYAPRSGTSSAPAKSRQCTSPTTRKRPSS